MPREDFFRRENTHVQIIEYFEHEGVRFTIMRVDQTRFVSAGREMTRSQHVHAQDVLNRKLEPLALASLGDPYPERFEADGYMLDLLLPGPARAMLVDKGPPFQMWNWANNEYAWLGFDLNAGFEGNPSTAKDTRLVKIDGRAFKVSFAADESTQRFAARLSGFLSEEMALEVHIMAPSSERRDQIVAGIATMRVVASPM